MSEQNPEPTHQDPAEPNEIGTEVETEPQAEPVDPNAVPEPVEPEPTPVEPEATPVEPGAPADQSEPLTPGEVKTDNVHGKDYTVTPNEGYRRS